MKKDGTIVYPELEAEIAKSGYRKYEIAEKIGINFNTFTLKLNGKHDFSLTESLKLWEVLSKRLPMDVLFRKDEE